MPGSPERPIHEWRIPPKSQSESDANPFEPLLREQRGEGERSHEEMVAAIRQKMAAYIAERKPYQFDPVAWMRDQIIHANTRRAIAENLPRGVELGAYPYAKLIMAWDIIALPHYKNAYSRGRSEDGMQERAKILGHTITLTPNESKLLSAMAEVAGIPNTFGQLTGQRKP